MDGLAASLAAISAGFFAIAAAWYQPSRLVLVVSVALARRARSASCRSTCGPGKRALSWMGDSGSQLIGFLLAALGLASAYTVASSTLVTLLLPVLVLAVPILDTTLVTVVRLLDGRSIAQGGRDHSSHRLVSLGVSETGAVVLLAAISAALGGTSLAYEAFGDGQAGGDRRARDLRPARAVRQPARRRRPRPGVPPKLPRLHPQARGGAHRRRRDRRVVPGGVPAPLQRARHGEPAPLLPALAARRSCSRATSR